MTEFTKQAILLALAATIAVLVGFIDQPVFGVQLHWLICAAIGLVLVYGGLLVVVINDD